MAGKAACHRMDGKAHGLALRPQTAGDLGDRALRLGHRHAVSWHDNDVLRVLHVGGDGDDVGRDHLALDLPRAADGCAPAAEDHRQEVPVHRAAHDIGQDRARRADQRARHD